MPSNRSKRTRSRRAASLTPAELQWLTGEPQDNANRFELIGLESMSRPADFDRAEDILTRAAGVVTAERIAELRAEIDAKRANLTA